MPLPKVPLPTAEVELPDGQVTIVRGLSREEAMAFTTGFTEEAMPGTPLRARGDAAEVYLVEHGCEVTAAEARAWRKETPYAVADAVLGKILELSGLSKAGGVDPQASGSEP